MADRRQPEVCTDLRCFGQSQDLQTDFRLPGRWFHPRYLNRHCDYCLEDCLLPIWSCLLDCDRGWDQHHGVKQGLRPGFRFVAAEAEALAFGYPAVVGPSPVDRQMDRSADLHLRVALDLAERIALRQRGLVFWVLRPEVVVRTDQKILAPMELHRMVQFPGLHRMDRLDVPGIQSC